MFIIVRTHTVMCTYIKHTYSYYTLARVIKRTDFCPRNKTQGQLYIDKWWSVVDFSLTLFTSKVRTTKSAWETADLRVTVRLACVWESVLGQYWLHFTYTNRDKNIANVNEIPYGPLYSNTYSKHCKNDGGKIQVEMDLHMHVCTRKCGHTYTYITTKRVHTCVSVDMT